MSSERRHGGLPLAIYVVALLLVPLAAFGLFGSREIARNNEVASATVRLANLVELRSAAANLRTPMQVERLAALGLAKLHELGVEPGVVVSMTGLDFEAIRDANHERFVEGRNRVLTAVGGSDAVAIAWAEAFAEATIDLEELVARMTTDDVPSTEEVSQAFEVVDALLDQLDRTIGADAVFAAPPSLREANAVANVNAVADVVTTATEEMLLVTDLGLGTADHDEAMLVAASLRHQDALASVKSVNAEWAAELDERYADLDTDFSLIEDDGNVLYSEVMAMSTALIDRVEYVEEIADFVIEESETAQAVVEDRRAQATEDNQRTMLTFGLVGVATLIFGIVVIRSFARPLTRLRLQAEQIGRGELSAEPLPLDGPSDVRKVTGAVNDMNSTLTLVEEQMQALALSDLDGGPHVVELPGKVGASMRNSMERVTALTTRLRTSEARLAEEARIDALTGLPNRFAVLEYLGGFVEADGADDVTEPVWPLDHSVEEPADVGVMFLDVDGFKSVNDTHGHAVGDVVLREIAQRLRGSVRDVDYVARLGGDEFLVVVDGVSEPDVLAIFGERLIREIEQPYVIGDQLFAVSASVGATLVGREDDPLSAIERADAAVYQAKRRGRRRVEMYDHELQASIEHQAELELALRQAIQHDELRIHLQPLADLATGQAAGAEVLVRWERPGVGLVPPNDFIPIAERSGLIFDLERWVLSAACQRAAEWRLRGLGEGMRLAVNISGRHLIEGDLLSALDIAVESTGADPNLLEIELTESHLLDDVNRANRVLAGIRDRGIRVAIDDFGTGYSSMTYLQKLPVDIVKIDRSFVASATSNDFDSTVIESVVTIGKALSLEIVAEGIETREQLDYVIRAGCTYGQGYHLARPVPIDEAESIMFGGPLFRVSRDAEPEWLAEPPTGPLVAADLGRPV